VRIIGYFLKPKAVREQTRLGNSGIDCSLYRLSDRSSSIRVGTSDGIAETVGNCRKVQINSRSVAAKTDITRRSVYVG
jgi:hypothetical protein